ncbi:ficolin-1-like [Ciona intestinalis]
MYMKCLNEVPIHVDATVKPSDSSLPHQFNLTVKRVEKYSFLVEILRTDLDSGWENILLTVHWTALMKAGPTDCRKLYDIGYRKNDLYNIYLDGRTKLEVYCDLENHGGGWTVIQRNVDNRTDFDRNWSDYKTGFGNKLASFWIGLENIRALTKNGDNELRIDITTCNNTKIVAEYSYFMVGPESDRYRLNITGYQHQQEKICDFGNPGNRWQCGWVGINQSLCEKRVSDAMIRSNGQVFSTKDMTENDCPNSRLAGWWYGSCGYTNLNGKYDPCKRGFPYAHWRNGSPEGLRHGLRFVEMKIRPR